MTPAQPADRLPPEDGFDSLSTEQLALLVGRSDERWSDRDLVRSVSDGGPVNEDQVTGVYVPLAQLIAERLPLDPGRVTSLVGITGSVASGKSTIAGILAEVLRRNAPFPSVDLLGTDAFLYPNQVLEQRGLLERKGFPETFDHQALIDAVAAVKSGQAVVEVPVYDHRAYDVLPGAVQRICRPDVLLIEGLTVLQGQPADVSSPVGPSPEDPTSVRPDLAIYIDAAEQDVAAWHRRRLLALRDDRDGTPTDFSRWFASLSDEQAGQVAESSWTEINLVNLRRYVAPTRSEADVILVKGSDHRVSEVRLRRR